MDKVSNISYAFIPFSVNNNFYERVIEKISTIDSWIKEEMDLRYLFRFVSNKVNGSDGKSRCCHYVLRQDATDVIGSHFIGNYRSKKSVAEDNHGKFGFVIDSIEMFLFSTDVCILAIKVVFDSDDPDYLINARYNLKYVSASRYKCSARSTHVSLMNIAKESIAEISAVFDTNFFYYTNGRNEIAFIMSFIYQEQPLDNDKALYYLRNNLSLNYHLSDNGCENDLENFSISENIHWGVTDQSVVCIGYHYENFDFVEKVLFRNFQKEYKYMFVFLLHQKYVLYHFLMQIDTELKNNLDKLEDYKKKLSEFKTYFVFSRISEVIQYQTLYTKATKAFALESMYEDVNEPLMMIDEIMRNQDEKRKRMEQARLEESEKRQAARENKINLLLSLLSLLSIVSAFSDANQFTAQVVGAFSVVNSENFWQTVFNNIPYILSFTLILGWSSYICTRMFINRRGKKMKNNCLYTGFFVDRALLVDRLASVNGQSLERKIEHTHVTVKFKPKVVPMHLFGEKVRIIVTGYGNDARNEGLLVEVESDNDEINHLLSQIPTPHITLSVSSDGDPVDTAGLDFKPIKMFEVVGVFGEMTKEKYVNTDAI